MDDHFDTSGVFEISKFDISKLACILNFRSITAKISGVPKFRNFTVYKRLFILMPVCVAVQATLNPNCRIKNPIHNESLSAMCLIFDQHTDSMLQMHGILYVLYRNEQHHEKTNILVSNLV